MFVSVMAIFHERLPCAKYYFRQRRKFKENYLAKKTPDGRCRNGSLSSNSKNKSSDYSPIEEEKVPSNDSPIRALAAPQMLTGWSPTKPRSPGIGRPSGKTASVSPDFRIRKGRLSNSNVHMRQASLGKAQNASMGATQSFKTPHIDFKLISSSADADGSTASPKNLVEVSKMRKLDEARRKWQEGRRKGSFHISNFSGSSLPAIRDGSPSSPLSKMGAFGKRADLGSEENGPVPSSSGNSSTFKRTSTIGQTALAITNLKGLEKTLRS